MRAATRLPKHMPALDGIRGIAVLLVVFHHVAQGWGGAWSIFPGLGFDLPERHLPDWFEALAGGASRGVQLFFIVSAFTLTARAAQGHTALIAYALRRTMRVGPAYWLAGLGYTLFAGLVPRALAPDGISFLDIAAAALFLSAWQGGASLAVVPGGWSVSCEVSFYFALPVILWLADGRAWRAAGLLLLATAVAQGWLRHQMASGQAGLQFYWHPIEQAPVFLCGVLAGIVAGKVRLPRVPGLAPGLIACAIGAVPFLPVPRWHLQPHFIFAAMVAAALALAAQGPSRLLANPVLRRIGELSYSIYLLHFAFLSASLHLATALAPGYDRSTIALHFLFTLCASAVAALATHRFVEMPPVRWAGRFGERGRTLGRLTVRER